MTTVQDPSFWKRFSVAAHQAEEEQARHVAGGFKHSYVLSLNNISTTASPRATTPTSQSHLSPAFANPLLSPDESASRSSFHGAGATTHTHPARPAHLHSLSATSSSSHPSAPPPTHQPQPLDPTSPSALLPSPAHSTFPKPRPNTNRSFTRHANSSALTIGFSGRPASRFKFWTHVTADPSHRDSWLEAQTRKKKQRAWICWAFWLGVLLLIAAVVVVVIVLRQKNII